jgi:preprotein translocase subunit SecA
MDYLQEGINLRAMGQKDPLVEWQRDGYAMFTAMMTSIAEDFVKYVMHLDVVVDQPEVQAVRNVQYSAAEDPVQGSGGMSQAAVRQAQEMGEPELAAAVPDAEEVQAPVVKAEHEKLGRNQPCWCGSGKKFKLCHGRA